MQSPDLHTLVHAENTNLEKYRHWFRSFFFSIAFKRNRTFDKSESIGFNAAYAFRYHWKLIYYRSQEEILYENIRLYTIESQQMNNFTTVFIQNCLLNRFINERRKWLFTDIEPLYMILIRFIDWFGSNTIHSCPRQLLLLIHNIVQQIRQ